MTIKKLIKELQELDPDLEVVLASDAEGNSFGVLDEVSFDTDTVWDDESNDFVDSEHADKNCSECVVLFPR